MKIASVVFLLCILCSVGGFAQSTSSGMWNVGVGAEVGVPMGDFNNYSSVGFGGIGTVGYMVDENLTVTGKIGFLSFSGKDQTVTVNGHSTTVSGGSVTVIPILVGGRYFFMPPADMRIYGSADIGIYNINNGGGSKFGFAPAVGAQFKAGDNMKVDVHADYTYISTDVTSTTWLGIGVGLVFDLK
jgi:opacity protein-like surface antigen